MSVWLLNPLGHTHDEGLCFLRNFVKGNRSQVLAAALHALRPPHLPLHGRAPTGRNAPVPHLLKPHNPGRTCTQCLRSFIFATHSKKGAVHRTDAVRGERKMSKPQEPSASTGGLPLHRPRSPVQPAGRPGVRRARRLLRPGPPRGAGLLQPGPQHVGVSRYEAQVEILKDADRFTVEGAMEVLNASVVPEAQVLTQRLPSLRLVPNQELRYVRSAVLRGLKHLHVEWDPAPAA